MRFIHVFLNIARQVFFLYIFFLLSLLASNYFLFFFCLYFPIVCKAAFMNNLCSKMYYLNKWYELFFISPWCPFS